MFEDLKPYVCTFPDCGISEHFFDNLEAWYKHETQYHRVYWCFNTKGHPDFQSQSLFIDHMSTFHGTHLDVKKLDTLRALFQKPSRMRGGQCNLCAMPAEPLKTHVAHHLQQMALFALPRVNPAQGSGNAELNSYSSRLKGTKRTQRLKGTKRTQPHANFWEFRSNSESSVANIEETHVGPEERSSTPLKIATNTGIEAKVPLLHDEFVPTPSRFETPRARHAKDAFSTTALVAASEAEHPLFRRWLFEQLEVDVNAKDDLGNTALIAASKAGHASAVRLLLEQAEMDVNAKDHLGKTELIHASKAGQASKVRSLF